jgi:hypothetical protein
MLKVNNLNCTVLKLKKIMLLYDVYSVFLSCVHPKLLKLKFAQDFMNTLYIACEVLLRSCGRY